MEERALSRAEVAARLGCSTQTVRRLEKSGALPPPRQITPGKAGHLESTVTEYLRSRPAEPMKAKTAAMNRARWPERGDTA